ncbi:MAG: ROK family protein [Kiritimatiellia bacterium]
MQKWNRQLVLALARRHGRVSHSDLVRESGLSAGTVSNITRQLRRENFLNVAGKSKSVRGRCSVNLEFNPSAKYILSATCLYEKTSLAIVDLSARIVARTSFPTKPERGIDVFMKNFEKAMNSLLKSHALPRDRLMALAASFEGVVEARTGTLVKCARMGWKNIPLKKKFESWCKLDVFIENDIRATLLGEFTNGVGKSAKNLIYLALGSGIGAGFLVQGRIYYGSHQMEGEIGHIVKDPSGPVCRCGKRGCLEALASGTAIADAARRANIPGLHKSATIQKDEAAFRQVLKQAEQGNKQAGKLLEKAANLLGGTMASIINLLDPEKIILAGYMVAGQDNSFFNLIRNACYQSLGGQAKCGAHIGQSALGDDAALVGGAILACRECFSVPEWK